MLGATYYMCECTICNSPVLNCFIFLLIPGHDTTSSAISWCLYALAGHTEDQRKCREEVQGVLETNASSHLTW